MTAPMNTLMTAITETMYSISDAAEKASTGILDFFSVLIETGDLGKAWDACYNDKTKRSAVDDLATNARQPQLADTKTHGNNEIAEWEHVPFIFNGKEHRLTDDNFYQGAYSLGDTPTPQKGRRHQLVLTENDGQGNYTKVKGSPIITGSCFAFALRAGNSTTNMNMMVDLGDGKSDVSDQGLLKAELHQFGTAYVMKAGDWIFIKKDNGQVQVEDKNGFKVDANQAISEKFNALISAGKDASVDLAELKQLVIDAGKHVKEKVNALIASAAEQKIRDQVEEIEGQVKELFRAERAMSRDIVALCGAFYGFEAYMKDDRTEPTKINDSREHRANKCVEFLETNKKHLQTAQTVFPMKTSEERLSTGDKYLDYSEKLKDLSHLYTSSGDTKKAQQYDRIQSNLASFQRALEIIDSKTKQEFLVDQNARYV